MRMAAPAQCHVATTALLIVLRSNACPMVDCVAQSHVCRVTHDNDMGFATSLGHRRDPR